MIRKLMAGSAILALMSAGAISVTHAQTDPAQPVIEEQAPAAAPAKEAPPSDATLTADEPTLASAYMGRSVYSSADPESDNIGDVNDLIVDENGSITHAVVGVGGFLGIGEKNVAVPFDELEVVEREGDIRLVYAATKEQLEAAEAFDRTAYDPSGRYNEELAAQADAQAVMDPNAPPADTALAPVPAEPVDEPAADTAATEEPAPEADVAASEEAAPADEAATEDMAASDQGAPATMDADEPASDMAATEWGEDSFRTFSADQVRASTLIGAQVNGPDDQSIGEISDLILQQDGGTRAALIDVGGFLGAGEKTVAIPFSDIQVQADAENPDSVILTVASTQEQLEAMPAYEPIDTAAVNEPVVDEQTVAADPNAPATDQPADQMAANPPAEAGSAEEPAVTGSLDGSMDYHLATQDLSASQLLGATVYGPNEESIGEIGDVVFNAQGDIDAVVLDVGGFLGMGEKPVAVGFDRLNVRMDENGTLWVMIDATQEQLEQAPNYDTTAAVQQ